jgi:hypothetical protein
MKTMFQLGFRPAAQDLWNRPQLQQPYMGYGRRPVWMGQAAYGSVPTGTLTEAQRLAVLGTLKEAIGKGSQIDAWIHAVGEAGQKSAMGDSYTTFRSYIDRAADLAEVAYPIYQRLQSDNTEDWWVLEEDGNKVVEFANTVDLANQLFTSKVKNAAPVPKPAVTMGPTGGALPSPTKPGAAPTGVTAAAAAAQPAKILGIPQTEFLIGAGVLAGVGILAAVL